MSNLTELFTWVEEDPVNGEGTIACMIPGLKELGVVTLVTRNRKIAEGPFRFAAELHARGSGHRVTLVRWSSREDLLVL